MKTHEILFAKLGENSTTAPDPIAVWKGQVDLETTETYCLSSDDDRLVSCKKYSVGEVSLPDWLPPEEWVGNTTAWKYTWGMGVDKSWPEAWQRGLAPLSAEAKLACVKLLKVKTFRSQFRAALCTQLKTWLETPASERKHNSPFSTRQWECLMDRYTHVEAKRTSESLYHSGRSEY